MTCPVSPNPISLADVQAEFGGSSSNIALQNYYAGGANVPSGTTSPTNGPVPTSGAISIQNFWGTKKFTPVTHQYTSGSGNETIPSGAVSVTITVIGPGGPGGNSVSDGGADLYASGGGGGGGGRAISIRTVAAGDWSGTLAYVVGVNGTTHSTVSGTLNGSGVSMTGQTGQIGGSAASSTSPGAGGSHGSASGGTSSNTDGGDGGNGNASGSSGQPGGAGGSGFGAYGSGANGADAPGVPGSPQTGFVEFAWT